MNKIYSAVSKGYNALFDCTEIQEWQNYIVSLIQKYSKGKVGVDLGCGTGFITSAIFNSGYEVSGVDSSIEMLNVAKNLHEEILFIMQDITKLHGFKNLSFVTAINDVFNYLTKSKLKKAIQSIHKSLTKGGLFVFDISSKYKLENVLANNEFTYQKEDYAYIWQNTLKKDRVIIDFTCFTQTKNGLFERFEETQTQYIHTQSDIITMLEEAGFKVEEVKGHLGKKLTNKSDRINFIAIKQ